MGREELENQTTADADDPAPTTSASSLRPSEVLAGRYEILGVLGMGGMGTVYRVRDRELDEIVALKTLRQSWIDAPGALERFKREVKLARRVTHPNVARTFDIGEHRPSPDAAGEKFLTMELVEGRSLAQRIDEAGVLAVSEALSIAAAITDALVAAHAASVIHRDLKPDNVLLGDDGRVVVSDFGIARTHTGDVGATGIAGTPAYMAPEQVQGLAVDARSDLYALGLLLYEMLVGVRAWAGDQPFAVAAARLVQPPPDPSHAKGDLPKGVSDLVRRLLARAPADRPASATVVRGEIATLVAGMGSVEKRPTVRPLVAQVTRSLAVFPLRGDSRPDDAWLADSATDDLLDALCLAQGLRVRTRTATLTDEDARAFGRRLGVELVLDGSLRRVGDSIRLTVRLASVTDGFQVWAGRYSGSLGELLSLVDRAAREAGGAIAGTSLAEPARLPVLMEDVERYLRARHTATGRSVTAMDIVQLESLREIAREDPRLLSLVASGYARMSGVKGPAALDTARVLAMRAIELAPTSGDPWLALAYVHLHGDDSVGAVVPVRRAIRNAPSLADAYDVAGRLVSEAGLTDESTSLLDRAIWLDPRLDFALQTRVRHHAFAGDWDRATRDLELLREIGGATSVPTYWRCSLWRGQIIGDPPPADERFSSHIAVNAIRAALERSHDLAQRRAALRAWEDEFAPRSRMRRLAAQIGAEVAASLGDTDAALDAIRRSVAHGLEDVWWTARCPLFAPMLRMPAFVAELDRVRARADAVTTAWQRADAV